MIVETQIKSYYVCFSLFNKHRCLKEKVMTIAQDGLTFLVWYFRLKLIIVAKNIIDH